MFERNKLLTRENIKIVVRMWGTHSRGEIAKALKFTGPQAELQVSAIATNLRKAGLDLPRKVQKESVRKMIQSVLQEMPKSERPMFRPYASTKPRKKYTWKHQAAHTPPVEQATPAPTGFPIRTAVV